MLMMLGALLLGWHYVKKMVMRFTDPKPMGLPTLQMSPAEMARRKERFESFQQAVREHRAAKPLTLTADEINALIAGGGDQQGFRGKVVCQPRRRPVEGRHERAAARRGVEDVQRPLP